MKRVLLMHFMCGCCVVIILLLYVCLSVCYNDCETLNCYLYGSNFADKTNYDTQLS